VKAVVYEKYGAPSDVLRLTDIKIPIPEDDEVLVRVRASSINSRDWRLLRANPFFIRLMGQGLLRPKAPVLGVDVAGRVEVVGRNVTRLRPGDEVFGYLSLTGGGTFVEYAVAGQDEIALKPDNLSFEQAAAVPLAAVTALQALRENGNVQPGQKVVIQGASGGVGTFAVQLAKAFGAEVTAVCSTRNLEMVRALGADHVVDYTKKDFTQNGERYDLILAVNGFHPLRDYLGALTPEGTYVVVGGSMRQILRGMLRARRNESVTQKTHVVTLVHDRENLAFLKDQLESGQIAPVVDACYPLDEVVKAFRYYEDVHPQGKVVITAAPDNA
jgi:NADPH:quinone reductase-like Zn-dependent oxidoreductase